MTISKKKTSIFTISRPLHHLKDQYKELLVSSQFIFELEIEPVVTLKTQEVT